MDRERVLPAQTVIVENQHIVQIGALDQLAMPKDAARIDGTGLYLIPGLADLHAHLQSSREVNLRMLQMFVAAGVTTILNMRGEPSHLELRKEVASGRILGPRIYSTGPFIGDPHPGILRTTPADIKARVHADKAAGYDFIKLHGDLAREAYEQLLSSAASEHIRVVGHAARNLGIKPMLDPRFAAIASNC